MKNLEILLKMIYFILVQTRQIWQKFFTKFYSIFSSIYMIIPIYDKFLDYLMELIGVF